MKKNIINTYLLQVTNVFFSFFLSIFIARILEPSERGQLVLFTTSTTFISLLLEFSLGTAVTYYIASAKFSASQALTLIIFWCSIVLLTTIITVALGPLLNYQQFLFSSNKDISYVSIAFIVTVAVGMFSSLLSSIFSGKQLFNVNNGISLGNLMFTFLVYGTFWILDYYSIYKFTAEEIILTSTAIVLIRSLIICGFYHKFIGELPSFTLINKSILKTFLSLSIFNYLANLIQFLSFRMDFWFVNYFKGSNDLGIYSLAVNLAQLFWLLPNSVGIILYPNIASKPPEEALKYTQILCRLIFSTTIVFGIVGALALTFLLPVLYGKKYEPAVDLIYILLIGIIPYSLTIIITTHFAGIKKNIINLYTAALGFTVCVFADLILVPNYGIKGASVATVLTYLVNTIFIVLYFRFETKSKLQLILLPQKQDISRIKDLFIFRKNNNLI